jgi:protoporphyrin/coproporphyrin ferrochelatase
LKLGPDNYTVAFQSRLSKNWMAPFTDDVLHESLSKGYKRILVAAPSFVADCLETLIEIGEDYQKLFKEAGGEKIQLVSSLNSGDLWIEALAGIITESIDQKIKLSTSTKA